ncbi:MAG: hypothetical protein ACE5FQ_16070, partial [Thiogranum sp.]
MKFPAIVLLLPGLVCADWTQQFGSNEKTDWASITRIANENTNGQQEALAAGKTLIVTLTQQNAVGGMAEYYAYIENGGAEEWTQYIMTRVLETGGDAIWQIGNEINGKAKTVPGYDVMPTYVEYFLAPTLAGIFRADRATGLYTRVMLGSVANAGSQDNRDWLRTLLDYRIQGTYAPDLAGWLVRDVIDIASIHYMATASRDFDSAVADIQSMGVPVWATEEVGRKVASAGLGGAVTLRVVNRYLNTGITSLLWGSLIGSPSGNEAMQTLSGFLGAVELTYQDGYWDAGDRRIRVLTSSFDTVQMADWAGELSVEIHVFRKGSKEVIV